MKLKRITYNPDSLSHHQENIQYWITQGITIDGTHYSIEEYFVREEVLYAIVSEDKRTFYEYPIADLGESKTEDLKKKITELENRKDNYVSDVTVVREGDTIKLTYSRIDGTSSEVSFTDHDTVVLAYDDTELRGRVTALESKEDKDTIYDDTEVKNRITALESKEDKDTIYDDTDVKARILALETKPDKDTVYDDTELKGKVTTLEGKATELTERDTALEGRIQALETKPDKDTVYDDTALVGRVSALESKEDNDKQTLSITDHTLSISNGNSVELPKYDDSAIKSRVEVLENRPDNDTVYNDEELRNKIIALEGKTDNFVSNVGVSREGNSVKLTYTMVNGDNKEVSFTDNDTVSVAYDDSALRGRVEALENKPEVEYELAKTVKAIALNQGEGVINLIYDASDVQFKELVLNGNVSARVKSPFGGTESTVAGKVGFSSGTTGDAIIGSHTTSVNENVYVDFYYTDSTMKAYLVYEPDNENGVVKYRKVLSLAELQGTEPARISISKGGTEQGYVEAIFTIVTLNINSYKVQKKG